MRLGLRKSLRRPATRTVAAGGVALACLIATGVPDAAAVGGGGFTGKFENLCSYTHTNQDDAILFPNRPGASAHLHDYVSNPAADANSTAAGLRAGTTNCVNNLDFASYWAPTLYSGTTAVHTASDTIYYLTNGKKNVQPYPFGFKEIAGNARATNPSQAQNILWGCSTTAPTLPEAPNCASGEQLHVRVNFADCWDGVHLDSPDHVSHVAYSTKNVCPAGFPVPIPMLSILFKYPTANGAVLKTSAGMGTYSMHADFFNAWDVKELQHMVTMCLDAGKDCGRPSGVQ